MIILKFKGKRNWQNSHLDEYCTKNKKVKSTNIPLMKLGDDPNQESGNE